MGEVYILVSHPNKNRIDDITKKTINNRNIIDLLVTNKNNSTVFFNCFKSKVCLKKL